MEYRFFKSTHPTVVDEAIRVRESNELSFKKVLSLRNETGCENIWRNRFGYIVGFEFSETPNTNFWKKAGGGKYMPKVSVPAGRQLRKRMSEISNIDLNTILEMEIIGLPCANMCVFTGNAAYSTSCAFVNGIFYARIPWPDFISKDDIERYKNKPADKVWFDSNLNHMLWEKPDCLTELKEWEFLRDLDNE